MSKYNLKSIIVGLIVLVVGVFLALMDTFVWKSPSSLLLNIGCSLVASSLVILLTTFLVDMKKLSPLDEWGISKIYSTRSEKNADSDPWLKGTVCNCGSPYGYRLFDLFLTEAGG